MELVKITSDFGAGQNLLSRYGDFEGALFFDLSSGTGSIDVDTSFAFSGSQSLKLANNDYNANNVVFAPRDNRLLFTAQVTGTYYFAVRLLKSSNVIVNSDVVVRFTLFVNGVPTFFDATIPNNDPFDTWFTFGQLISLNANDEVDFTFAIMSDIGSLDTDCVILVDALQIARSEVPVPYSSGSGVIAWERLVDLVNVQPIPATTNTIIDFSGGDRRSFGGITLLDSLGFVTPFALNDVISIDFSFEVVTPSGTNNYFDVWLEVNGVKYRQVTIPFLKGSGIVDQHSFSWTFPVEEDLLTFGGTLFIRGSVKFDITNKYINVVRYE